MTDPDQGLLFGTDGQAAYQPVGSRERARAPARARKDREPPVARDQPTSVRAGRRIRLPAKTFRGQVLDALRAGAKTDEEICRATGLRGSSVRPRRLELVQEGLVEDSGQVRPTHSGRDAIVWRIKEPNEGTGCGSR